MNLALEPAANRRDAFAIVADRRGLLPLVIEKDFWVCWILERIFALPEFTEHILFKGGTSLSKVYGVIQRFSEDIDLSLNRSFFGDALPDPETAGSNSQRKHRSEVLVAAFHVAVGEQLLPKLRRAIAEQLGDENNVEERWMLTRDVTDPGTLRFTYPRAVST